MSRGPADWSRKLGIWLATGPRSRVLRHRRRTPSVRHLSPLWDDRSLPRSNPKINKQQYTSCPDCAGAEYEHQRVRPRLYLFLFLSLPHHPLALLFIRGTGRQTFRLRAAFEAKAAVSADRPMEREKKRKCVAARWMKTRYIEK